MSADKTSLHRPLLITGAAGFIGSALALRLLERGERVVGIDNLNAYYDPALKRARLARIEGIASDGAWRFESLALEDEPALMALFAEEQPRVVVNLAERPHSALIWGFYSKGKPGTPEGTALRNSGLTRGVGGPVGALPCRTCSRCGHAALRGTAAPWAPASFDDWY